MIWLPSEEYSGLDSAIRSRYANKIPDEDVIEYRNHLYRYSHNTDTHEIVCIGKEFIEGKERMLKAFNEKEVSHANKKRK